ncbi:hypothetical protein ACFYOF_06165 [Streptomyces sp. NPDC007148]|uniref:hypothetical protein n=1 Tax=Streptomyces sp. NPDC007148 TaxID=3364775 RepID=UPI003691657A
MSDPTYRDLATRSLDQAAQDVNEMPRGIVSAVEIQSRASKAQAIATIAVAQALLEIGDVLRQAHSGSSDQS